MPLIKNTEDGNIRFCLLDYINSVDVVSNTMEKYKDKEYDVILKDEVNTTLSINFTYILNCKVLVEDCNNITLNVNIDNSLIWNHMIFSSNTKSVGLCHYDMYASPLEEEFDDDDEFIKEYGPGIRIMHSVINFNRSNSVVINFMYKYETFFHMKYFDDNFYFVMKSIHNVNKYHLEKNILLINDIHCKFEQNYDCVVRIYNNSIITELNIDFATSFLFLMAMHNLEKITSSINLEETQIYVYKCDIQLDIYYEGKIHIFASDYVNKLSVNVQKIDYLDVKYLKHCVLNCKFIYRVDIHSCELLELNSEVKNLCLNDIGKLKSQSKEVK